VSRKTKEGGEHKKLQKKRYDKRRNEIKEKWKSVTRRKREQRKKRLK
jgi:hypothetical protein